MNEGTFLTQTKEGAAQQQYTSAKNVKVDQKCAVDGWIEAMDDLVPPPKLPPRVDPEIITENIAADFNFSSGKSRSSWRKLFCRKESLMVLQGAFWWIFLDQFRTSKADFEIVNNKKQILFDHIAEHFYVMLMQLPPKSRDSFMNLYPDALAQSITQCLLVAFPGSKMKYDQRFNLDILEKIAIWIQGEFTKSVIAPVNYSQLKYTKRASLTDMVDLDKQESLMLPNLQTGKKKESMAAYARPVLVAKQKKIENCPLIEHIFKKYNIRGSMKLSLNVTHSHRNYICSQHADVNETYDDIAVAAEVTRRKLIGDDKKQRIQLSKDLKVIQKNTLKLQQEIKVSQTKALRGDVHQLSNYLVSLWKIED